MKEKKLGKVYIVGAGCGDAELITWKGLRLLRQCDVVLYDDLSAARLLEETLCGTGGNQRTFGGKGERRQECCAAQRRRPVCVWTRRGGNTRASGGGRAV